MQHTFPTMKTHRLTLFQTKNLYHEKTSESACVLNVHGVILYKAGPVRSSLH